MPCRNSSGELCTYAGGTFDSSGECNAPNGAGQIWDPYSGVYNPNVGAANYNPYAKWTGNGISIADHDQFDTRIDQRFGERDTLSARFS